MEFEGRARINSRLDVAPLVDVVFLLLIFFLLTSTYIAPEAVELDLPSATTARAVEDRPVVVSLDRDDRLQINGRQISLEELPAALSQSLSSVARKTVTLRADASVELQELLVVIDRIREAGALELSLAARRKSATK